MVADVILLLIVAGATIKGEMDLPKLFLNGQR